MEASTEQRGRQQPPERPKTPPEGKALGEPPGVATAADEDADVRASLKPAEEHDATEWYLTEDDRVPVYDLPVTVIGPEAEEVEITWTIKPLDGGLIDKIERRNVKAMPGGEPGEKTLDRLRTNAEIVVEATVRPDLNSEALRKHPSGGRPFADPVDALRHRFRHETGVIEQLAAQVRTVSGYGPDRIGKASMRLVRAASG